MDSHKTWRTGWECHKEECIQFWWRSESRSGYNNYLIFNWFFTIERWGWKWYCMISQKSWRWIQLRLGGQVGCVKRTNWFDFDEGQNPDPDSTFFSGDSSPLREWGQKLYRMLSLKVVDDVTKRGGRVGHMVWQPCWIQEQY